MSDADSLARACAASMLEYDKGMQALGITLCEVRPGFSRMRMTVREDMLNSFQSCYGGMMFSLADCAFAYACNSHNEVTVASGCDIDFVRPARLGDELTAIAEERTTSGRSGIYDVEVVNQNGETVAHMRGRCRRITGTVIRSTTPQ